MSAWRHCACGASVIEYGVAMSACGVTVSGYGGPNS